MEEPNYLQFKFSILQKSDHIPKISVNQRGTILTDAPPRSLPLWHQNLKGHQLPIYTNHRASCQPVA